MYVIRPSSEIVPRHVYDMARQDNWIGVLDFADQHPEKRPLMAILAMDYGFYEGLERLLSKGLNPNSTVSRNMLRGVGFHAPQVSLVDVAVILTRQGVRPSDSMSPVFSILLGAGAQLTPRSLNHVIENDDAPAAATILNARPELMALARRKGALSGEVFSVAMMQVLLDHGFALEGKSSAAKWIWKVSAETCKQSAQMVEYLADRGMDIDTANPTQPRPSKPNQSRLEHDLETPSLVIKEEVPFLAALVCHGARLENIDIAKIIESVPELAPAFSSRQAKELAIATPASESLPRIKRI